MAITPNTDFTSGQILTATQQNQFPRGIVAYAQSIVSDTTITTEEIQITSTSFTAVANRYYRITYFEPDVINSNNYTISRIRKTNLSGTVLNTAYQGISASSPDKDRSITMSWVGTLTAGSQVVCATMASNSGTAGAARQADLIAYLLVEDIGPA